MRSPASSAGRAEPLMTDFFHMGGYGFFVWGSYGMMAAAIALELWLLRRRRRHAIRQAELNSQENDE